MPKLNDKQKEMAKTYGHLIYNQGGNDIVELCEREDVSLATNTIVVMMQISVESQLNMLCALDKAGLLIDPAKVGFKFVCVGVNCWGQGETATEAKKNCRREGGATGMSQYMVHKFPANLGFDIDQIDGHLVVFEGRGKLATIEKREKGKKAKAWTYEEGLARAAAREQIKG